MCDLVQRVQEAKGNIYVRITDADENTRFETHGGELKFGWYQHHHLTTLGWYQRVIIQKFQSNSFHTRPRTSDSLPTLQTPYHVLQQPKF